MTNVEFHVIGGSVEEAVFKFVSDINFVAFV